MNPSPWWQLIPVAVLLLGATLSPGKISPGPLPPLRSTEAVPPEGETRPEEPAWHVYFREQGGSYRRKWSWQGNRGSW